MAAIDHGGELQKTCALYGGNLDEWLDLSTGISPVSFSLPEFSTATWQRLPEEAEVACVSELAGQFYGNGKEPPLPVAGTQAYIQTLVHLFDKSRPVLIISPTYGEYAHCFLSHGFRVAEMGWAQVLSTDLSDYCAVVIVNPNNPDGRICKKHDLLEISKKLKKTNGYLIVDEAFADFDNNNSVVDQIKSNTNIIVSRSFGKFFGLAGVRLGFVFSSNDIRRKISNRLGPWAVSGPALAVAKFAFERPEIIAQHQAKIIKLGKIQSRVFSKFNLNILGKTALFTLIDFGKSSNAYDEFCRAQILARKFSWQDGVLRLGLVKNESELARLENVLKGIHKQGEIR